MGGTKTTIGISGRQSLLRKNRATVSWEECIRHLPLRSNKTVELCGMDYSFPISRNLSVVERKDGFGRRKVVPHTLRQPGLCRSQ